MAFTRADFDAKIASEISTYPTIAALYNVGDPRISAHLGAMAGMLTMLSQQIDTESMEPFSKVRDTTVLADASMKGILPFARPPRLALLISNGATSTLNIAVGREVLDQNGRSYSFETQVSIVAGGTAIANVKQVTTRTFQHTVDNSQPFYPVPVPPSDDSDVSISGLYVSIEGTSFPYTPQFANLAADEPGYALETDEYRNLMIKFGWAGTVGVQPPNGTIVDVTVEESYGATNLTANAPFIFSQSATAADSFATMTMSSVIFAGADPVNIEDMREWAKYPSTYDENPVYMGNFDFCVRRQLRSLRFLSIWNEQVEEGVRGANVQNINRLFIAALMDNVDDAWLQAEITRIIRKGDDSYRLKYVPATVVEVPLTITAEVSVVHDTGDVEAKIRAVVYAMYGMDSQAAKRGMMQINKKLLGDQLKASVVALQDDGADYGIVLGASVAALPEQYRYVTPASLTVNVTQATYNDGVWSY
ncbi:hypothetical protein [Burkholderia gladioli]|uniref:hypothetical protein n=1 Tax=Burkholderia gladioli TaxID=28095 RepID=UPI0016400155|nr:hypothetical protein [Burkholderia gladioli]